MCYVRRFRFFGTIQQSVKLCEVLGLWITNPYSQHCTLLEELYHLNIPWKQLKYNPHNAYQAVSRVTWICHVCYVCELNTVDGS